MASIPANLSRVPNSLASSLLLASLNRTNIDLVKVQSQFASGKAINAFSDDAIAASAISVLNNRLKTGDQTLRNLSAASNLVNYLDSSLGDGLDLVRDAKAVASSQIGVGSDSTTRNNQAVVVDGMISQLFQLANRSSNGLYLFGGSTAVSAPMQELRGGFRYVGRGNGLYSELGPASDVPITLGGESAIGNLSSRIKSTKDLDPTLTPATRLSDLNGARGLGIARNEISFSFDGGPTATISLGDADTVGDVITRITSALRQYESDNSVTILGPGGVSVSGGSISIDVVGGAPAPDLRFTDVGSGVTGADLGLTQSVFNTATPTGTSVDPKLTLLSTVSSLSGVTVPLGTIRFRFTSSAGSSIADVDLAGAQTIDEIRSRIESTVPGVRVQVNAAGTGIDVLNEIAGPALSIEPTGTGPDTASELGIRTLDLNTKLTDFNDGQGVQIVDNVTDPITGSVTRARNIDFRVTLGNGQVFDVDLRPQDIVDVQSLIARINSEFVWAVTQPPINASAPALTATDFAAGLSTTGNGIVLTQTGITGEMRVEKQNNSPAADQIGLTGGTYDPLSASLTAQDRAGVRVDNIFTALVRLRDALRSNDSDGIAVAGSLLDAQTDRLAQSQALVGVYANRLQRASSRQEDENIQNEKVRSQLQDVDYAEASLRFNLLNTQLQAALRAGSQAQNLTLLDFLR